MHENEVPTPEKVAFSDVDWHDWRYAGKLGPKPRSNALSVWEDWIATDPE